MAPQPRNGTGIASLSRQEAPKSATHHTADGRLDLSGRGLGLKGTRGGSENRLNCRGVGHTQKESRG